MILKLTPTLTIAHDAQTFKIETKSAGSSSSVSFKLGEEFKEVTGKGGKETRSVAAAEPDRLVMQSVTDDVEEERSLQINQKGELVQVEKSDICSFSQLFCYLLMTEISHEEQGLGR